MFDKIFIFYLQLTLDSGFRIASDFIQIIAHYFLT